MSNNTIRKFPLLKDYVTINNLGSGHYANVYKSFSKGNKMEFVAVKVFPNNKNLQHIDRITHEVEIFKKLQHRNVVHFIDYIVEDKLRYIVMEYCDGGTLRELINKSKRLSESLTRLVVQQLANGLNYLSSISICHMDLKPENILLNMRPPYRIKISDFGLSQDFANPDVKYKNAGTIVYMAPEKILNMEYGLISDLWSLGLIVRECLTGRQIFAGYSCKILRQRIISNCPIRDPTSVELSFDSKDLMRSLLQYDPNNRLTLEGLLAHPFVDMKHEICYDSYQKAKELITTAINFDENFEYGKSLPLYKEAMLFLQAFANVEPNIHKKASLNMKLWEYERWIKKIQKDPKRHHFVVVQPLPDLYGPWYENDEDLSFTSVSSNEDPSQPGTHTAP